MTDPSAILVISASLRVWNGFSLSKRHIFILTRYRLGSSLRNSWDVDLARVGTTSQSGEIDYVEEESARELLHYAIITENIVQQVASMIGQRTTLAFEITVEHATQLAEAFRHSGLKAAAVSGQTSRSKRERISADWRDGVI